MLRKELPTLGLPERMSHVGQCHASSACLQARLMIDAPGKRNRGGMFHRQQGALAEVGWCLWVLLVFQGKSEQRLACTELSALRLTAHSALSLHMKPAAWCRLW